MRLSMVILVAVVLMAAACSGDGDGEGSGSPATNTSGLSAGTIQPQPEPVQALGDAAAEAVDGVIEITISGAKFVPNRLRIKAGEPVRIRVVNQDGQPAGASVPHNLRIAGLDGEYQTEDDAVTVPQTIESGQTGEIIFAPSVPGEYTFRCDFHPGSMGGQIVVE